jgi:hypothetical protein
MIIKAIRDHPTVFLFAGDWGIFSLPVNNNCAAIIVVLRSFSLLPLAVNCRGARIFLFSRGFKIRAKESLCDFLILPTSRRHSSYPLIQAVPCVPPARILLGPSFDAQFSSFWRMLIASALSKIASNREELYRWSFYPINSTFVGLPSGLEVFHIVWRCRWGV